MTSVKGCDVCGGKVHPVSQGSTLGYCIKCGIVYFLRPNSEVETEKEPMNMLERNFGGEQGKAELVQSTSARMEGTREPSASLWICPDCGTRFNMPDESDLTYIRREHFREFHPNRITE